MRAFVSISAHGYGHLAQIAPVIAALKRRVPRLDLAVRSGLPHALLAHTFSGAEIEPCDHDFGTPMAGIACASPDIIWRVWRDQCARAADIQAEIAQRLKNGTFDLVLSAISPWPLGAAASAGLPSFGVGSFSWTQILRALLPEAFDAESALQLMDDSYNKASDLFCLSPGLGMHMLDATTIDGVVASPGERKRNFILESMGCGADAKIVVLAFGGMLPADRPPALDTDAPWMWVGPRAWAGGKNYFAADDLPTPFKDVIASADLVITKAGFGVVSELALSRTPSIMVRRSDWPEDGILLDWLQKHSACAIVASMNDVSISLIRRQLESRAAGYQMPSMGGEEEIADRIMAKLL